MGVDQPFLYDAVKQDNSLPYNSFDPKAVTRASYAPKPPRPKHEGPLISFNQHPDSYFILPSGNTDVKPMDPSVKKWIKWMRIVQLVLRCLELLCSVGLLVMMILIRKVDASTGWILRVVPGIAILHTVYGVYHLGRKPSGRTPASSASYMLFAAFFDISIVPFYVFGALVSKTQESSWTTVLSNQDLEPILATVVFYLATVGGAFYFISLGVSLYLAVTFRKITKLPPDMNPLEDNLTSRHKRNKSSMSVATTMSEKRLTSPLESKYSSGAAYEDLSRPPTIPFFHTRSGSVDSFSTYKATPPPSRDARHDLPSLKHQVTSDSARSSRSTNDLKRKSQGSAPLNRGSYTEVPLSDNSSQRSPRKIGNIQEAWFTADSLATTKRSRSASPKKASYQPLHQRYDSDDLSSRHAQALEEDLHTPSPLYELDRESPLTEIRNSSGDIADLSPQVSEKPSIREFKAKGYGELKPGTPPIMIGASRQVSSGIDFPKKGGFWAKDRDVSGKLAEEGRGGDGSGWGARFRKVSGR